MDGAESCGFSRRRPGSARQGNGDEPRAEQPACSAAEPRARGKETVMKRTRQFPALAGLVVCALIGGCPLGPEKPTAPAPPPPQRDLPRPPPSTHRTKTLPQTTCL